MTFAAKKDGKALWNSALALETLGHLPEAIARAEAAMRVYEEIESPAIANARAVIGAWRGALDLGRGERI